jgi:hypothetical protein
MNSGAVPITANTWRPFIPSKRMSASSRSPGDTMSPFRTWPARTACSISAAMARRVKSAKKPSRTEVQIAGVRREVKRGRRMKNGVCVERARSQLSLPASQTTTSPDGPRDHQRPFQR